MKLAVLRVRGVRKVAPRIRRALELLRLEKPNHCVVLEDTPQNMGMIEMAKDYVTYGPVSEATILSLLSKRGRKGGSLLRASVKEAGLKKAAKEISAGAKTADFSDPVFRLNPPSRGFRNTKTAYPNGDLGRRQEMDSLLKRMM